MPSKEVLTALQELHEELEKLEPAIRHIEAAEQVTRTVKEIPERHKKLIEEINQTDKAHKQELKVLLQNHSNTLISEIKRTIESNDSIQAIIRTQLVSIEKLRVTIESFHERIERIKFPERLDKLDATVSGIMVAVQAIQSRLDLVERNLTDRLKDLSVLYKSNHDILNKRFDEIMSATIKLNKRRDVMTFVTWILIILGSAVIFYFKK